MIVVTDTSVVLNLAWLRLDELLNDLYKNVLAPPEVLAEFNRLACGDQRFQGLHFPEFVTIAAPGNIPLSIAGNEGLDAGEMAALALALERGIRDILIDESAGRAAALTLGLRPSGLLGVLVQAKKQGLVPAVLPLLDLLKVGARFRIGDDLRVRIGKLAGEISQ